jgi:hypothetical protein
MDENCHSVRQTLHSDFVTVFILDFNIRGFPFVFNFASSGIWFNVSAVFVYIQTEKFEASTFAWGARAVMASETSFMAFT